MLTYLFTAEHKDGTIVKQTIEDKSATKEKGSAFSDVVAEDVKMFEISDGTNVHSVSIEDGSFMINGTLFHMYDKPVKDRRLIYFRRNLHTMSQTSAPTHRIEYHIGWQANDPDTGENIQRVIFFE